MSAIKVFLHCEAPDLEVLFDQIAEAMAFTVPAQKLGDSLRAREKLSSTNLGKGLAFPHSKIEELKEFQVGVFVNSTTLRMGSAKSTPVDLFVVVLAPKSQPDVYIKLMGRLSKALNKEGLCQACREASDLDSVIEILGV